jgi:hypothetical protein
VNTEDRRDRSVEQLLRRSLAAESGGRVSPVCLDAETLAAWMDGTLDTSTASAAEAHASSCARCQALVAAMVRSAPDVVVARAWWRRDWRVRWVVPLTAAATAALVWTVVPDQPRGLPAALRPPPPASVPAEPAPSRREAQSRADTAAAADRLEPDARAELGRGVATAPPANERSARPEEKQTRQQSADARARQAPQESAAAPDRRVANEAVSVAPIPATPPPPATAPADNTLRRFGDAAILGAVSGARDILSTDPAVRWRIAAGRSVSVSTNAGATWEVVPIDAPAELLAGSSPSPSVCWLVGRAGAVLRTTDGRKWERVPFPESVDLTAVQASDAQTAAVTASDGRTFRTVDGGRTWIPGPVQVF